MIQPGERIPDVQLQQVTAEGTRTVSAADLFRGKKAVLFAVPGAFTPTCSDAHLPGFQARTSDLKAKGVELIACLATNDAFVMAAWGKDRGVGDEIALLADGNSELTRAMGLAVDLSRFGLGERSRRYAAVLDDGVVQSLQVEPAGGVTVSGAEAVLRSL